MCANAIDPSVLHDHGGGLVTTGAAPRASAVENNATDTTVQGGIADIVPWVLRKLLWDWARPTREKQRARGKR